VYHKIAMPVGAVAAGGGVVGHSLFLIVAGATILVAGAAFFTLVPKRRSR
jgi:hypothetical protein